MPRKKIQKEEPAKKNIEEILGNTELNENTIVKLPLTDSFLRDDIRTDIEPTGYDNGNLENFSEITQQEPIKKSLCLWCRHDVNDFVCGMPIQYDSLTNHYTLYGNFCSFECASAYNFSKNTRSDRVWDINNMINMMAKSYGYEIPINPAPSYELLDIFMGSMDIKEFRCVHKNTDKFYAVNIPPHSYVPSVAEILNTSYINNKKSIKNVIEKMI
tara:strand:+ start:13485 stop:14129 length:645 start_codon:yes stop_codon:yes gene_type:complete